MQEPCFLFKSRDLTKLTEYRMPTIQREKFGDCPKGQVDIYTLTNDAGHRVRISTYGAAVQSIQVPDRDGKLGEVVIGYDEFPPYLENPVSFGTLIGRYANRIGGARFAIGKTEYQLAANLGEHCLHGGPGGFGHELWDVLYAGTEEDEASLQLHHISPAGTNGFPGRLAVSCHYIWTNQSALIIEYHAMTERPTVVSLTNHSYFNLAGSGRIYEHELEILADKITATDQDQIPTGELLGVGNTPFDFRNLQALGEVLLHPEHQEIARLGGIDHNYAFGQSDGQVRERAYLYEPSSGRSLTCYSTMPGLQLFTANFEDGAFQHRGGAPLLRHGALCLETQHYPDAPNHAHFPSPILWPEEEYRETTEYWFGVRS